ncbi:MAG: hypothetical protein IPH46_13925 [Bacteroidetes bacterium]|nr:hypothetical protein [Bacteroidota bacterium]
MDFYVRRFVNVATRYPIKEYIYIGEKYNLHSIIIDSKDIIESDFYRELRKQVLEVPNDKLQFIYFDLQNELYPTIENYNQWYDKNLAHFDSLNSNYNFYKPMYEAMQNTKREIERINDRLQ